MLKACKLIIISFFLFGFTIFTGCSNDPVSPVVNTITVTGKVTNYAGAPISGVSAGINGVTTITSSDGSFSVNNVTVPYDLKLMQINGTHTTCIEYAGLTTASPVVSPLGLTSTHFTANLNVILPSSIVKQAIITYSNGVVEYSLDRIFPGKELSVEFPNENPGTGNVMVLVVTTNSDGKIVSYDNFGMKSGVMLTIGSTTNINFTSADLSTDPGEQFVTGNITNPSGYGDSHYEYMLSYNSSVNLIKHGTFLVGNSTAGDNFNEPVPTGLPVPLRIAVRAFSIDMTLGSFSEKFHFLNPAISDNSFTVEAAPIMISPADNSVNVDSASYFSYTLGGAGGVHILHIESPNLSYYIYSTSENVKFPSFNEFGIIPASGTVFNWYISEYMGSLTTDDHASASDNYNLHQNGLTQTNNRVFTFIK